MQMLRNVRTHTLPSAEVDLAKTGARVSRSALEGVTPDNFTAELGRSLMEVQHLFDGFFKDRRPGDIPLLLSLPANDRRRRGDPLEIRNSRGRAGSSLHQLARLRGLSPARRDRHPRGRRGESCRRFSSASRGPPIRRSPSGTSSGSSRPRARCDRRSSFSEAAAISFAFSSPSHLSRRSSRETLANRIELLDLLAEGAPPGEPPNGSAAARPRIRRAETTCPASRALVRGIAAFHSQSKSDSGERPGGRWVRCFAGRLRACARRALRARRRGSPGLALFAAGSVATRSARFGSDLDLVAVTTGRAVGLSRGRDRSPHPRGCARGPPRRGRHAAPRGGRGLAPRPDARLLRGLSPDARFALGDPRVLEVPLRLRQRRNGGRIRAMLRRTLPIVFAREGWKRRLLDSRAKLAALSKSPWDVKHAPGGLYDIDFILSAARLHRRHRGESIRRSPRGARAAA